ncbi:ribose ABC transporter substrate-binding protein RbsB [Halobacillus sp. A5]|uniref:ribose ABC transporter substrate-binding protein RbsB n=1 Tax=Halobacillus sp. A5 TaxID=2880263 RepID=UPI0020A6B3B1|nr:ribose ABC transporter substrate-binding protein RbsB [Halobacillus sp. A5]MCP3027214.1 ribose ABC transporter substrate-binding protein RbsB [Halobacillus sp. A5]
MRKWLKTIGVVSLLVVMAACSTESPGSSSDDESGDSDESIKIGMSISTLNNPFFVSLRDGAEAAAEEAGYEITTADAQDDSASQVSDIEDLIQQDIDVLLVNPTDSSAISSAIESANSADIPVITVDRTADEGEVVTHIASDNVEGGEMAGEYIAEQLEEEGDLVELEGISGASATRERGEGFHNIVDELDGMEVAAQQSADFDRSNGLNVMENILQSNNEIDAVFAHNDEMALGAVEALESNDLADEVVVVGFDATADARDAVSEGRMDATVAQQPELIGEEAIATAGQVVDGEEVDEFIPVELELITE